jgi:hypothetical protein
MNAGVFGSKFGPAGFGQRRRARTPQVSPAAARSAKREHGRLGLPMGWQALAAQWWSAVSGRFHLVGHDRWSSTR